MTDRLHAETRWSTGRVLTAALGLALLGGGLRALHLDRPSMWVDELYTVRSAIDGANWSKQLGYLPHRWWMAFNGIDFQAGGSCGPACTHSLGGHPHAWRAAGIDETMARLPAWFFGTLALPILFLIGCGVVGAGPSFAAALVLAVSPWHLLWSQNARFYALQFLFANVGLLCYLRWWAHGGARWAVGAVLALGGAVFTQPTALVLFAVLGLDAIVRILYGGRPAQVRKLMLALGGVGALAVAVIGFDVYRHPERWTQFFRTDPQGNFKTTQSPIQLGFSVVYLTGPAVMVMAAFTAWSVWRRRDKLGLTLILAAILPAVVWSAVGFGGQVWERYLFYSLYPWLLLAVGAVEPSTAPGGCGRLRLTMALAAAAAIPVFDYFAVSQLRPQTREAVAYVKRHRQPDDLIFMDPTEGSYYFEEQVEHSPADGVSAAGDRPGWMIYRSDYRGTEPAPRDRDELNARTVWRASFGDNGIGVYGVGFMARVDVRYRPVP